MNSAFIFAQEINEFYNTVRDFLQSQGIKCNPNKDKADFTVVLGGDGTVLAAGRQGVPNPIVVINTGHLGFLTSGSKETYQETLTRFLQGSYTLTKRCTLRIQAAAFSPCEQPRTFDAVNEVVFAKNQLSKLVRVSVHITDRDEDWKTAELVAEYRADGLIISTPTGSTAYNLSAGGPIIHPSCESFVITPICPQGLTQRPLIIPGHMKVRVQKMEQELFVTVDSQDGCPMHSFVDVYYNSHRIETVDPPATYFQILRQKLGWGVKPV